MIIKVDGVEYTTREVEVAIRECAELRKKVKELLGPFTCGHNPEYAGGACAACHAIWLDAAEKAEKRADVAEQQFTSILGKAMELICAGAKCEKHSPDCPGSVFRKWAIIELAPSNFVGKPSLICPECSGGGEIGLSDGEVPCQSCCGSGLRSRKGPFYQKKA